MRLEEIRSGAVGDDVEGRIWAAREEIAMAILSPHSA